MQVRTIDRATLDAFVYAHPYGHHMKTSHWGELLRNARVNIIYLGFYDHALKATAMVIEQRALGGKYWYIPFGPCVDYLNKPLLKDVMTALNTYSKKQKAFFVRIDPNQERREHMQSGEVKEDGYNYEWVTDILEQSGFQHLGYNYGYSGNWQPRFTYILDIDKPIDDIIRQSYKENQTYYRKNCRRAITVREGSAEELHYLETFGIELSHKLGFAYKTKEYFREIMEHYPDHHLYLVAEADLEQAIRNITEDIDALRQQAEELSQKVRNQGRVKEITREISNLEEEIKQIRNWQQEEGNTIVLGAALFVYIGTKSFDLYMYSRKGLTNFRSPISLHFKAMELLQKQGVKQYDFVGISGSLDRQDPYYGLYDFKRRFNGRFVEYLGEFDCVHKPAKYKTFLFVYRWTRRIQRKITRMKNQGSR